jgi:hypothetical protein
MVTLILNFPDQAVYKEQKFISPSSEVREIQYQGDHILILMKSFLLYHPTVEGRRANLLL